jgi:type IV pilus assembly protein PilM
MSTVVALDIGSSAVAGVELTTRRHRVSLTRAEVEPLPAGLVRDGEIREPEELALQLRRIWRAGRFGGKRVRLGVANQRVVVRTIEVPAVDDERERRAMIEFQAAEQIPIPAEQAVLDYQPVLRYPQEDGMRERCVVVAAHREMVETLVGVTRRAGLVPTGIDLEAFAILRALLPQPRVIDEGSADGTAQVVCHVGAEVTNIIVSVDRRCHFTRLVGFGGAQLTKAVAERTGHDLEEAEALKLACGLLGDTADGWDEAMVADVRHALALACRPLVREVSRSLDFYRSQAMARPIDRLILSGGTSLCAGLDRYLQQGLGIRVEAGDPARQVDAAAGFAPHIAARAAVAVGLALDAEAA